MAAQKLDINVQRLLRQCETIASEYTNEKGNINWRLEKYVNTLQQQLSDLQKMESKPCPDKMQEYGKRVKFLSDLIQTEKKKCPSENMSANQKMAGSLDSSSTVTHSLPVTKDSGRELHLKTKAHIEKDLRNELFAKDDKNKASGVRNRRGINNANREAEDKEDVDAVLQYHQEMQEKIADEMVRMAQSLKHTSQMASNIIKEDNKNLDAASRLVDSNFQKLKRESERVEELTERPCSLWVWLMLLTVCVVFMMMITFIKVFPKRS